MLPLDEFGGDALDHARRARPRLHAWPSRRVTALLFGLAPALRGSAVDLNRALKEESSAAGGGVQHARLRKTLVVAQVALSTLLVAGAGLFARSLTNLKTLGPGFDTENIVSFTLDPSLSGRSQTSIKQLYASLVDDLRGAARRDSRRRWPTSQCSPATPRSAPSGCRATSRSRART